MMRGGGGAGGITGLGAGGRLYSNTPSSLGGKPRAITGSGSHAPPKLRPTARNNSHTLMLVTLEFDAHVGLTRLQGDQFIRVFNDIG